MRIDDSFAASNDLNSIQLGRTQQTQLEQQDRQRAEANRGEDSVALSSLSADLARAISKESPEEIARVEGAQQAFETGALQLSSEASAEALIKASLLDGQLDIQAQAAAPPAPAGPE